MTPETFKKCIQDLFYGKKPPAGHTSKIRIGEEVETLTFPKFNEAEQAALYVKRPEGNFLHFNGVDYELIELINPTFCLIDEDYPDLLPSHEIREFPYKNPVQYIYQSLKIGGKFYGYKKIKLNK